LIPWDRTKGRPEPISALNRVREADNHEPLVDMREHAPSVKILRDTTIPYCRLTVARMAEKAARLLPTGYQLGVSDAWRPIERQQRIYEFMMGSAVEAYPDRSYASLRRTVCKWVAPTDQKAPPGHCTGAALDVYLLDATGEPVDVTSPYGRFRAARTYSLGLTPEAYRNRMLLVETMLFAGFSNCRDEWWHYSYGDAGWAVRVGKAECFYGLATLDRDLYEDQERLAEEAIRNRPNPFLNPDAA
jgi:zinc D-Ala-D-Ala dipeptidase